MKNQITIVSIILFSTLLQACVINDVNAIRGNGKLIEKYYDIEEFKEIELKGGFNIVLIKGDKESLAIETDENLHQYIFVEDSNDKLELSSGRDVILRPTELNIEITYKSLEKISTYGASKILSKGLITSDSLIIDLSGAASGEINISTEQLVTVVSGAADLTLTGNSLSHKAILSGASNLKASELITKNTDITLNGAGAAIVHASGKLKAQLSGVGSIKYLGNPVTKNTNISGIGQIKSTE